MIISKCVCMIGCCAYTATTMHIRQLMQYTHAYHILIFCLYIHYTMYTYIYTIVPDLRQRHQPPGRWARRRTGRQHGDQEGVRSVSYYSDIMSMWLVYYNA